MLIESAVGLTVEFLVDMLMQKYSNVSGKRIWSRGCKESILVQTHKRSLLIMGLHIFEIKLC